MLVNPVERPALAQGFSIGQPDLGLAHARERRPGQGVEGAAAAQRWTTAKPLLASVVQAVLDDTHRAAMRAPARGGKIFSPINASNAALPAVARANRSIRTHCSAVIECRIAHSTAPNDKSSMPVLP